MSKIHVFLCKNTFWHLSDFLSMSPVVTCIKVPLNSHYQRISKAYELWIMNYMNYACLIKADYRSKIFLTRKITNGAWTMILPIQGIIINILTIFISFSPECPYYNISFLCDILSLRYIVYYRRRNLAPS